jgi:hypothetical protein
MKKLTIIQWLSLAFFVAYTSFLIIVLMAYWLYGISNVFTGI